MSGSLNSHHIPVRRQRLWAQIAHFVLQALTPDRTGTLDHLDE
jgi:hypothetical protein